MVNEIAFVCAISATMFVLMRHVQVQISLTFHVSQIVVRNSKMASCVSFSSRSDLPELPSSPHQPSNFTFPKRCFGNKIVVQRSCQRSWFERWPFLHYDEGKDVVFCHTCVTGFRQGKMKSSKAEPAFVSSFPYSAYVISWLTEYSLYEVSSVL